MRRLDYIGVGVKDGDGAHARASYGLTARTCAKRGSGPGVRRIFRPTSGFVYLVDTVVVEHAEGLLWSKSSGVFCLANS